MTQTEEKSRAPWVILFVLLAISVSAAVNEFKVPPTMSILMKTFHMNAKEGGSLMSVFFFLAIVFGLPAGFVFQRMGYRFAGCLALICLAAGSVIGAFSTTYWLLFFSRFLEGVGFITVSVVAPAIIGQRFPKQKKGTAMGIYSLHMTFGTFIAFSITPAVVSRWGWQGLWWVGALLTAAMLFVFLAFFKPAPSAAGAGQSGPGTQKPARDRAALKNPAIYMCMLVIACLLFLIQGVLTWLPAYLVRIQHYTLAAASLVLSVRTAFVVPSNVLGGWLTDRFGWRLVCVVPMFIDAVLLPLSAFVTGWPLFVLAAAQGLAGGVIAPAIMTGSSELAGGKQQGMAMAMMGVGRNLGALLGPVALGAVVDGWGWVPAFLVLGPVAILGGLSGVFIFKTNMGGLRPATQKA